MHFCGTSPSNICTDSTLNATRTIGSSLFFTSEIFVVIPNSKFQIPNSCNSFLGDFNPGREIQKKVGKLTRSFIFGFSVCSQKYRRRVRDLYFVSIWFIGSQIWLNIPGDGCHFFLHLPIDDDDLAALKKLTFFTLKKILHRNTDWVEVGSKIICTKLTPNAYSLSYWQTQPSSLLGKQSSLLLQHQLVTGRTNN
jgi:hypothetical protein